MAAEKTFENKIKDYLKAYNYWHVKFFANMYTKVGVPDILACINGCFVGIEVKALNGRPSELQKYNVELINQCGGYAVILYPNQFNDFVYMVQCIRNRDFDQARITCEKINERR